MRRLHAFELIQGRLSDFPENVQYILPVLAGDDLSAGAVQLEPVKPFLPPEPAEKPTKPITKPEPPNPSVEPATPFTPESPAVVEPTPPVKPPQPTGGPATLIECVKLHTANGELSNAFYQDLRRVFDLQDLGTLPVPQRHPEGPTTSTAAVDTFKPPSYTPSARTNANVSPPELELLGNFKHVAKPEDLAAAMPARVEREPSDISEESV